jgi:hypothetical protein
LASSPAPTASSLCHCLHRRQRLLRRLPRLALELRARARCQARCPLLEPSARMEAPASRRPLELQARRGPVRRRRLRLARPGLRRGSGSRTASFSAGAKGAARSHLRRAKPPGMSEPTRASGHSSAMSWAAGPPSGYRTSLRPTSGHTPASGHSTAMSRAAVKLSHSR